MGAIPLCSYMHLVQASWTHEKLWCYNLSSVLFTCLVLFYFFRQYLIISLCCSDWPRAYYVDQTGLKQRFAYPCLLGVENKWHAPQYPAQCLEEFILGQKYLLASHDA